VLFEIKSKASASDIYEAVGQLQIYDRLLGGGWRRVLVIPKGLAAPLKGPISALGILTVEFERRGGQIRFNSDALTDCLSA